MPNFCATAAPRPPEPLPPSIGESYHEGFDEPYGLPANQIDASVFSESWSGYSLNRSRQYPNAAPWLVPMVDTNGAVNVDSRGAVRLWFRAEFDSKSGPGSPAELLTLVTTNGVAASEVWSLVISADGTEMSLLADSDSGPVVSLSVPVAFQAGNWHLVTLAYTETNSAIFLDNQELGTGSGLPAVPTMAAPYTSLVVGSGLRGNLAAGQIDELSIFSGHNHFWAFLGHEFGLSQTWDIENYYTNLAPVAALGPISDAELAAWQQARAQRLAVSPMNSSGQQFGPLDNICNCQTGGQVYITNVVCSFSADTGWTVSFLIAGGQSGVLYDVFATPYLSPDGSAANTPWAWLGRTNTCCVFTATNQPNAQSFYILGGPLDSDSDGITDAYDLLVLKTPPPLGSMPSSDGYGTPDAWYLANGLNPLTAGIGSQDANGNGIPNYLEYLRGSNPQAASNFGVWVSSPSGFSSLP